MAPAQKVELNLHAALKAHQGFVNTAVYNTGSSYILTGGQDRLIKLWNPQTGAEVKSYSGHGYEVLGLCCTHDNSRFASCGGDRNVLVWDVTRGETIIRCSGHNGKINAVAFNSDSSVLASGSYDTTVRLWDMKARNRTPLQVLDDAKDSITSVKILEHLIIVASVDGHVRTYDVRQGELRVDDFHHPVVSAQLSKDKAMLLAATLDSKVRILDTENGKLLQAYTGHSLKSYRSSVAFGQNEATVVIGDDNGDIFVWDVEGGTQLASIKAHDKPILWTSANEKKNEIVTASADGSAKVWKW